MICLNQQLLDRATKIFFQVRTSEIIQKIKYLVIKITVDPKKVPLTLHRTLLGESQIF